MAPFDQRIDLVSADGIVSSSAQVTELLPTGVVSGSDQLTSSFETQGRGIISSSEQLPSGIVSSSAQVVDYLPSGVISGSDQITQSLDLKTVDDINIIPNQGRSFGILKGLEWIVNFVNDKSNFSVIAKKGDAIYTNTIKTVIEKYNLNRDDTFGIAINNFPFVSIIH